MLYNIKLITSRAVCYNVGVKRHIYIVLMSYNTDPKPYIYSMLWSIAKDDSVRPCVQMPMVYSTSYPPGTTNEKQRTKGCGVGDMCMSSSHFGIFSVSSHKNRPNVAIFHKCR